MKTSIIVTHKIFDDDLMHLSNINHKRIKENTHYPYELVFVDNASDEKYISWLLRNCDTYIRNNENLGNAKSWDQGIKISSGETIILIDNDVWVEKDWDKEMIDKLLEPNVGITFPYSIVGDEYDKKESGFSVEYRGRRDGFCFAFRRDTYDYVGEFLLNQPFKLGYYEDDMFAYRVQYIMKHKLVACPSSKVWHKGQGTTKKMWTLEMIKGIEDNKKWYEDLTNKIYPFIDK